MLNISFSFSLTADNSYPYGFKGSYSYVTSTESRNGVVCKITSVCTNKRCLKHHGLLITTISYITDWSAFSGVFNNDPACRNDVTLSFRRNLESVYSIMMVTSVFRDIMENTSCQYTFDIFILIQHLELRCGVKLDTRLLLALKTFETDAIKFLLY